MDLITNKRVRHLPVLLEEKVVGIISIGDVVKSIIELQKNTIDHLDSHTTALSLVLNHSNLEKCFMATIFFVLLLALGMVLGHQNLSEKNGRFSGTCSSNNPLVSSDGEACGIWC
jgi:CBS domain-containing protein